MGFKQDITKHLTAGLAASPDAVVGAVLKVIQGMGETAVLVDGYTPESGRLIVGFKERGGKTLAKTWLRGGIGNPFQAAHRLQQVSPKVSVRVAPRQEGGTDVATKIEDYSFTEATGLISYDDLHGREPHEQFLAALSAALTRLDPRATVTIGS